MSETPITITAEWDDDAAVWVLTSAEVPGLVLEAIVISDIGPKVAKVMPHLMPDFHGAFRVVLRGHPAFKVP